MRTTVTLDDDVAHLLKGEMQCSGATFKQAVNHFLCLGLMASKAQTRKQFVVTPRPLGLHPGLSYDNVEALIETLERPAHK